MSELKVNTISEVTGANGVVVDSVKLKDGGIVIADAANIGSASDVDAIAIGSDGDITLTQDLELQHDGAILSFGANDEVSLTHVHDTGLLLNSTMKLQFNDATQFVQGISATVLGLGATDEIDLTATAIDINGTLDVSGASQFNGAIVMAGTTPTLTIGDAGAEDAKVVFDGNAQDFHIGLDDSADDLVIGVGSALGTTTAISITDGRVVTIGVEGIVANLAGIPFFADFSNGSLYTADVSGTDNSATNNTAYGSAAMDAITTGDRNTALGEQAAGALNTGANNVLLGRSAGEDQTTGDNNTAVGYRALATNIGGHNNVAIGFGAGETNVASANMFIGLNAGNINSSGARIIAIGHEAYDNADTENDNVAIGFNAIGGTVAGGEENVIVGNYSGDAITSGDANTAIGHSAGSQINTGSKNICVGKGAGGSLTNGTDNIVIGHQIQCTSDNVNSIAFGSDLSASDNSLSNNFIFGKASNIVRNVFTTNASWARNSDLHKKTNIEDDTLGLRFINNLRTVKFNWKPNSEFPKHYNDYDAEKNHMVTDVRLHGMIAQEVKTALDIEGVDTFGGWSEDEDGSQRISQEMFVHPLIRAVQELSAEVTELKKKLEDK